VKTGKLRVAFVNSAREWGGNEKWVLTAATGLRDRGHEILVVTRPGSAVSRRAERAGLRVMLERFGGDLNPASVLRLSRVLGTFKPDAVVLTKLKEYWLGGLAARLAGTPLVLARLGLARPLKNSAKYRLLFSRVIDLVITNSFSARDILVKGSPVLRPEKVRVVYNRLPPREREMTRAQARRVLGLPGDALVVAAAGRLARDKGFETLLGAFALAAPRLDDCLLAIAGQGERLDELKRLSREIGIGEKVRFLGFLADVYPLFWAADLFVLSSRVEGMANTLLEAMDSGLPVIATRSPGSEEALGRPPAGVLVDIDDVTAMAGEIATLGRDPEKRKNLGLRARERIESGFASGEMLDGLENLVRLPPDARSP